MDEMRWHEIEVYNHSGLYTVSLVSWYNDDKGGCATVTRQQEVKGCNLIYVMCSMFRDLNFRNEYEPSVLSATRVRTP